jgi:hypothetical protein
VSDRLSLVAGVRSTGISASPAIAELAVEQASRSRGWSRRRLDSRAAGRAAGEAAAGEAAAREAAPDEGATSVTAPDGTPAGEVVCPCRSVSRGEVETACRTPIAPSTLDAVKRRSGARFGDCQGNLCDLDVARILAAARRVGITTLERSVPGSRLFWASDEASPVIDQAAAASVRGPTGTTPGRVEAVVIGGGRAGVGAAAGLAARGVRVVVVERRGHLGGDRLTWTAAEAEAVASAESRAHVLLGRSAVGLTSGADGWSVLIQGTDGACDVVADVVIVATGGYVRPWEHRGIAGPRPAGVVTSDLVERATDAGLGVGTRAVVVGAGRTADACCERLTASGCRVVERLERCDIDELRGEARPEAVRVASRWIGCDTVVLADEQLPAPWILRPLGIVDARPATVAPADADGRLAVDGLWAAGTCVVPDVDHRASMGSGRSVAAAVIEAIIAARSGRRIRVHA